MQSRLYIQANKFDLVRLFVVPIVRVPAARSCHYGQLNGQVFGSNQVASRLQQFGSSSCPPRAPNWLSCGRNQYPQKPRAVCKNNNNNNIYKSRLSSSSLHCWPAFGGGQLECSIAIRALGAAGSAAGSRRLATASCTGEPLNCGQTTTLETDDTVFAMASIQMTLTLASRRATAVGRAN